MLGLISSIRNRVLSCNAVCSAKTARTRQQLPKHLAAVLLLFSTILLASVASAQDYDWIADIAGDDPDPVAAGGTIEYSVEVINNGPDTSPATTVQFLIPEDTILISIVSTDSSISNCSLVGNTVPEFDPNIDRYNFDVVALVDRETANALITVATTIDGFPTLEMTLFPGIMRPMHFQIYGRLVEYMR